MCLPFLMIFDMARILVTFLFVISGETNLGIIVKNTPSESFHIIDELHNYLILLRY